jgi:hypothetical protein
VKLIFSKIINYVCSIHFVYTAQRTENIYVERQHQHVDIFNGDAFILLYVTQEFSLYRYFLGGGVEWKLVYNYSGNYLAYCTSPR